MTGTPRVGHPGPVGARAGVRTTAVVVSCLVLAGCRGAFPAGSDAAVAHCLDAARALSSDATVTGVEPADHGGWVVSGDTGHDTPQYPGTPQPWSCAADGHGTITSGVVLLS